MLQIVRLANLAHAYFLKFIFSTDWHQLRHFFSGAWGSWWPTSSPSCRRPSDRKSPRPTWFRLSRFGSIHAIYSQSYKSFTGLYLQFRKYRHIFKINSRHKCCQIQYCHGFGPKCWVFKSDNKRAYNGFDYKIIWLQMILIIGLYYHTCT